MSTIVEPTQGDLDSLVSLWPGVAFAIGYASPGFTNYGSIYYSGSVQNQFGTTLTLGGSTPFEIGSVSQTFTATLYAARLRSQSATQTLGDYIAPKGVLQIGQQFAGITLDSLVNYTSGLPEDNRSGGVDAPPYVPFPYSEAGMLSFLNATDMTPSGSGTTYTYSDLAFAIMAAVLGASERKHASVRTYDTLVRDHIFEPLSMNSVFFDKASLLQLVQGYDAAGLTNVAVAPGHPRFPAYHGSGGIVASPNDMWQWLLFNMGITQDRTLSPLLSVLQTPSTTVQAGQTQLGLGWFISPAVDALPAMVWKDGGLEGFTSYIAFMPSTAPGTDPSQAGVFVLANANHLYSAYFQEAVVVIAEAVLFLMQGQDPPTDTSGYRSAALRRR